VDEGLRRLARGSASPDEEIALLAERCRAGDLDPRRIELAAGLGHAGAAAVLDQPVGELSRVEAFQRACDLGREVWVAAELTVLRQKAEAREPHVAEALQAVEAWLICPCEEHAHSAQVLPKPDLGDWPPEFEHVAWSLARSLLAPYPGALLCCGLSRGAAEDARRLLSAAGSVVAIFPDREAPTEQRRQAPEGARGGEWSLSLLDAGDWLLACVKAVIEVTGLRLRDAHLLVQTTRANTRSLPERWELTRAALHSDFVPWLLR